MSVDNLPLITITPAPEQYSSARSNAIVSKFYTSNNPASPAAAGHADDGIKFADIVDTLNPLQHLPVIGYVYRAITGDEVSTGAKVAGGAAYGALLGGPIGAVISMASAVFSDLFGVDEALAPVTPTAVAAAQKNGKIS